MGFGRFGRKSDAKALERRKIAGNRSHPRRSQRDFDPERKYFRPSGKRKFFELNKKL